MGDARDDRGEGARAVGSASLTNTVRWLRVVWAAPWSVLGLLFGMTFRSRRATRGVLLCEGASWPARFRWHYRAITFGHVVLCVDVIDEHTLEHELVHVRQYERWGPLFVPVYLLASLVAFISGRNAYRDNRFEIAARAAKAEAQETCV